MVFVAQMLHREGKMMYEIAQINLVVLFTIAIVLMMITIAQSIFDVKLMNLENEGAHKTFGKDYNVLK